MNAFMDAGNRGLTECVLLEVRAGEETYAKAGRDLGKAVRQTDYIGMLDDGKLYVLLANTNEEKSEDVRRRIRGIGYETCLRKVR